MHTTKRENNNDMEQVITLLAIASFVFYVLRDQQNIKEQAKADKEDEEAEADELWEAENYNPFYAPDFYTTASC